MCMSSLVPKAVTGFVVCIPQSKQRRTAMEDKHGGCMREMESLIDQFRAQIISKDKDPNENTTTIKGKENCM